jgi:nicotinamide riboside transporter PnuC
MINKIDPVWFSRIIRFGLGIAFIAIARQYEDAWPLYLFGGIFIVTGFLRPRRCIDDKCEL